jgi:ketosteroid isomerase-like protein
VSNEATAREYLAAIGRGDTGEALRRFFTPDFEQLEYPNALNPKGQRSDLASALERSERGKKVLSGQRFDIRSAVASGDLVALETEWTGVLAIPVASLPAGGEMRANFAMFLEFRDGRIARQRNYDCFQPF